MQDDWDEERSLNNGDWTWSSAGGGSARYGSGDDEATSLDWVNDISIIDISIAMALNDYWFVNKQIMEEFEFESELAPLVFCDEKVTFPRDEDTLFLLSWPSRVRDAKESRRLFQAVSTMDPRPLLRGTGRWNPRLPGAWYLVVEYWRRVYPEGVRVKPHVHHILVWPGDFVRVQKLYELSKALQREWADIAAWLSYRLMHPSRYPFRPPIWADASFVKVLQKGLGDDRDLTTYTPLEDSDELFTLAARFLAVCIGIMTQRTRYASVKLHSELVRACLAMLGKSRVGSIESRTRWDNFILQRTK
jgi:hypothetical protein